MNRSRWHKHLPIAVLVVGGGIAIAQNQTGEAVFPYVGYLEENGIAVTGERTVRVDLFATADATEAPCRSQTFSPVDLHAGRFQVEVTVPRAGGVYDACLAGGELYAGIAVGAADAAAGDLVALTSGAGGDRVRIGSVPFAAASPKAVPLLVADSVQVTGDVLADGTVSANALNANSAAINGALSASSAAVAGAVVAGSASISGALTASVSVSAPTVSATGSLSGGTLDVPGMWVPLARDRVTTSPRSILLRVPAGYRYLKLVYQIATTRTDDQPLYVQFNGDSTPRYNSEITNVFALSNADSANNQTEAIIGLGCRNVAPLTTWTLGEVAVMNVPGQTHQMSGQATCHVPGLVLSGGMIFSQWTNPAEISSIVVFSDPDGGVSPNLQVGSEVVLMGLR